jgi:hypothetical protein
MKNCYTNPALRRWDGYRAFHWTVATGFIQFETGELIYTDASPDPDHRSTYNSVGVQIVATSDDKCPTLLLPDGTPVKKAWLNRKGMQYLAIDLDLKVAVGLQAVSYGRIKSTAANLKAPAHLQGKFSAYWSGPERMPVGQPVLVAPPLERTPEQKAHIDSILAQCDAWCAMHDIEKRSWARRVNLPGKEAIHVRKHLASPTWLLGKTFSDLKDNERIELRDFGLSSAYDEKTYDHLAVKG